MNYSLKTAVAALSLFLSAGMLAQEKPLAESPEISTTEIQYGFFGEDQTFIYSSRMSGFGGEHHLFIDKVEKATLKTVSTTELKNYSDFQKETRRASFDLHSFLVKDKVYCFYQFFDNKKDTMYVIVQTIAANGTISEPYSVLGTSTRNALLNSLVVFSPDQQSFLVMADPGSTNLNIWDYYAKFVVDLKPCLYKSATLEKVWERNVSAYVNNRSYNVSNIAIDNKQNLYFVSAEKETTTLSVASANSPTIKQVPELVSSYLRTEGTSLTVNSTGDLVFCGVFADKTKDGRGFYSDPGIFIRVINPENLEVKLSKDYPFSADIMNKLSMGENTKKPTADQVKQKLEPSNLFAQFQVLEAADAYYFITEDRYNDIFAGKKQNKDIIVTKALKNGDLKYTTLIPHYNFGFYKNVKTSGFLLNNRLCIITGENPELASTPMSDYESLTMPRLEDSFGNVIQVNVADDGALSKKVLFLNKKHELIYDVPYSPVVRSFDGNKLVFTLADTRANLVKYVVYKLD